MANTCNYIFVKYDEFVCVLNYTLRREGIWGSGGVASRIHKLGIIWR
jgi:hypothetical protein